MTLNRSDRGFVFSLVYRGIDECEEKDTGIFIKTVTLTNPTVKVDLQPDDKVLKINGQEPKSLTDTTKMFKESGQEIELIIQRIEEV